MQDHLFPKCTWTRLLLISASLPPSVNDPFLTRSLIIMPLKSLRYPASTAARFTLRLQASRAARFNLRLQSPATSLTPKQMLQDVNVPRDPPSNRSCQRLSSILNISYQFLCICLVGKLPFDFWPMISLKPIKTYKISSALTTLFAIYVTKTFVLKWCESIF